MKIDDTDYEQLMLDTVNSLDYELIKKGDHVFHYGEKGDKFYMILRGSVQIYVPKDEQEVRDEIERIDNKLSSMANAGNVKNMSDFRDQVDKCKAKMKNKTMVTTFPLALPSVDALSHSKLKRSKTGVFDNSVLRLLLRQGVESDTITSLLKFTELYDVYFEDILCKFKKVRTMETGSYFGELAMSSNLPRGATVVASSDLHLLTLSKTAYVQIFEDVEKRLQEKLAFFAKLIGQKDAGETVIKFSYSFKERHYKYGQKIFSQGEMPSEIYIVKQGEVQVLLFMIGLILNGILDYQS